MRNDDLERVLGGTTPPPELDPALRARITASIPVPLRSVRPLPSPGLLITGLVVTCAAVGVAGAARAGLYGIKRLGTGEAVLILATLAFLACAAGAEFVATVIPGSRRRLTSGALVAVVSAAMLLVFALSFTNYHTHNFVPAGLACLFTGLLHAIPAALIACVLLWRGFAVDPVAAGTACGALAGLAGVTMLELHCPNFQALHVLVWHTAVVPVSAAAGAVSGWLLRVRRPLRI